MECRHPWCSGGRVVCGQPELVCTHGLYGRADAYQLARAAHRIGGRISSSQCLSCCHAVRQVGNSCCQVSPRHALHSTFQPMQMVYLGDLTPEGPRPQRAQVYILSILRSCTPAHCLAVTAAAQAGKIPPRHRLYLTCNLVEMQSVALCPFTSSSGNQI